MLYTRYYSLEADLNLQAKLEQTDIFFMGNSKESRAQKVLSILSKKYVGPIYSLNYDLESEKYTLEKSSAYRKEDFNILGKDLMQNFIDELKSIGIDDKNILIDITSIKHPILFYMLKLLKEMFKPKVLLLTYTEPEKYEQIKFNKTFKFDLTEKFCEVKPIPGFVRPTDSSNEKLLVALMGFEGNRFGKAIEDVGPALNKTHAIVGFPSFQPGWQYFVYSENQPALFQQSKAYLQMKTATANEPFGVYNKLEDIKRNNPDHDITIAPIGTKPHSLGVCMFAIDNEDVKIYYDFPTFGNKKRTKGIGKSFVYNLTDYINS